MAASSSKTVVYAASAGNFLVAVTKFIAAWWTGSSAMLSEAIHSLVDTGNQLLLLYGMHRSVRPPDELHPLGYGRELYFWSFVVAMVMFTMGAGVAAYATPGAAQTFDDDLEQVRRMGIRVVSDDEAVRLDAIERVALQDLDLPAIRQALAAFDVAPRFDGLALGCLLLGSLDEVGQTSMVNAWGKKTGERLVANLLLYNNN